MTNRLVALGLLLALAACSTQSDDVPTRPKTALTANTAAATPLRNIMAARHDAFATLQDRGDLVGYAASKPLREGPSVWHRAQVSEEHALRAIASGRLRMTAPDGRVLDYRFVRHVEHPNGNWTWIGELPGAPGRQAIITFGERAVFGQFGREGAEPLQLTVRDGAAWIVEADARALRGVDSVAGQTDVLLPPKLVRDAAADKSTVEASKDVVVAAGGPVVDVVLGYTAGFASSLGGQSQAVTRLTHLIAITNQAYVSSNLNAQVRLVRTVLVNYTDASSNDSALNDLSGSDGSNTVPIPASLLPLRQARDQYGGDLVSFVRKFNNTAHDGCGLAWLLGGGGSGISSGHAAYGYSVVSDGSDGGFFCRSETLAHELGHNMGQNHNVEDSGGDSGVHPYSYGYRETTATGFFTIMAYRAGDSQHSVPYFANPSVLVEGRPAGIANAADNVRSLAQTMPIVAGFRGATVPLARVRADFDGDGMSDILWRNASTGSNSIWRSANASSTQGVTAIPNPAWRVAGTGDFDADGRADIFWRNLSTGQNAIWRSANSGMGQVLTTVNDLNWKIAGIGDFDGDGRSDVLWRHALDGRNGIWRSANPSTPAAVSTIADRNWTVSGIGDFNADGRSDILWYNVATGQNALWRSASSAQGQVLTTVTNRSWKVAGVGDFNGDARSDILWRQRVSGANAVWLSGNAATSSNLATVADQGWQVAGVADFDGDTRSDILWHHATGGQNSIWRAGSSANLQTLATTAAAWTIAP